jgi:hypothetical protein
MSIDSLTFSLQRVRRHLRLRHVDDTVDIERHLLRVRGPALVAEAVVVFAVGVCGEGVVFVGDSLLIVLAVAERILDLEIAIIVSFVRS